VKADKEGGGIILDELTILGNIPPKPGTTSSRRKSLILYIAWVAE
jgi:hypothetical protein